MGLPEIVLIAIGLSMDAFAVSIALGLSVKKPKITEYLAPGIYFGFFQALMPFLGFHAGTYFAEKAQNLDHWIAFSLLAFIGGKMIKESFSEDTGKADKYSYRFTKMLLLAIATSIDAFAVGITFAFLEPNIYLGIAIIGLITFFVSMGGVKAGNICGEKFKSRAELLGGTVLVLLGIKILLEHLL